LARVKNMELTRSVPLLPDALQRSIRVTANERLDRNGHVGMVLWLTGLSGAGKSTLAFGVERRLFDVGYNVIVLDGDELRSDLNSDLGFSDEDRSENVRRVAAIANRLACNGAIVIVSLISPIACDRDNARKSTKRAFQEIYVRADIAVCRSRDPKGLYARVAAGQIEQFTGVGSKYEPPVAPEMIIDTDVCSVEEGLTGLQTLVCEISPLRRPIFLQTNKR